MPELPEVETIKRYLSSKIVGKSIKEIKVLKPKLFIGDPQKIIGTKVVNLERRAKLIFIKLSNNKSLMIHLKLTGQLIWEEKEETGLPGKTTHIIISFNKGKLFYNDLRQFGWIKLVDQKEIEKQIEKLGPEPFSKEFTSDYLKIILSRSQRAVKLVLLDQSKIAGIGNIYANEALFKAGILPSRQSNSLKEAEIKKLRRIVIKVLKEGIKYKGSSAADEAYIQPSGEKGKYQDHFRVYQREGKKCRTRLADGQECGSLIKRTKIGGRGTFFCSKCQN